MATETNSGAGVSALTYGGAVSNGYSAFSYVLFIKSDATGTDRGFLHTDSGAFAGGTDDVIGCRYDAAGATGGGTSVLKGSIDSTGKTNNGFETSNNSQKTTLQCVIVVWEAGDREHVWLDGVEDVLTHNPATGSGVTAGADSVWLHRGAKDATNAWDGIVYELRFYGRRLTENEIRTISALKGLDSIRAGMILKWHPDQGAPGTAASGVTDRAGNGYNGTVSGTAPTFAEDVIHVRRRRAA